MKSNKNCGNSKTAGRKSSCGGKTSSKSSENDSNATVRTMRRIAERSMNWPRNASPSLNYVDPISK